MAPASAVGAVVGAAASAAAPRAVLGMALATAEFIAAGALLRGLSRSAEAGRSAPCRGMGPSSAMVFLGGVASGSLGIGGGIVNVPVMRLALGMPIHAATATSALIIAATASVGAASHAMFGHLNAGYALALSIGMAIGAQVGAKAVRRVGGRALQASLAALLMLIGALLGLRFAPELAP